ncbi:thiamine pyrophosphate-binding protein [Dorea sp. OM02-2LB]|nr:thiamine pyrophosphate-binding protein [Dorea sp. OM02-2LB]
MKKRVADIIFETLVDLNIVDCFTVVGGGAMHLDNALALNTDMNSHFNHHEQACAMAAESYARYSGKMAAVCVTSGPGATNTLTGVMGAWVDGVPMIVISGNVRYETSIEKSGLPLRYRGLQEFDIIHSIQNMTKYSLVLTKPETVKYEVQKAVAIAMEGRRGPVWIDVPQDMQNALVEEEGLLEYKEDPVTTPDVKETDLKQIFAELKAAKRPCILMGSGIQCAHLEDAFEGFLEKVRVPVIGGAWLGDIFYSEHPLYYGLSGNAGPRGGNFILQNSDYILCLGNSLSYKQTGYDISSFAPKATIVMVDADKNEYSKVKEKVDTFIHADLKEFFRKAESVAEICEAPGEWMEYCNKIRATFSPFEGKSSADPTGRVNKYLFWETFLKVMPEDTLMALGNSSVAMGANQIGRRFKGQRMISNYICGSMGFDLPAAIGLAVSSKQPVVCVTGDGSMMMNLQELQTIQYKKLPVKIVLFENNGYGAIKQTCKNFFEGKEYGCSPDSGVGFPQFQKVAEAFEYSYNCCHTNEELTEKLEWLKAQEGSCILEIKQQLDDPVVPKLMSKLDENGQMTSPKLHDMYPFVSEEDMKWIMKW